MNEDSTRPLVQDSMELARRINSSTDIVTDLTDVVQNELPKKSLQGSDDDATNTALLDAINNIDIDTADLAKEQTLTQGLSEIEDKLDHLDIDLSPIEDQLDNIESKIDNFVGSDDVSLLDIKDAIDNIDIDTTDLAKEQTLTQGISDVDDHLDDIESKIDDLTGSDDIDITGLDKDIKRTINNAKQEILDAIVPECSEQDIDNIFQP